MLNLKSAASALGGEVRGNQILCPAPGHSPEDRSLSVTFKEDAPGGFLVHTFAEDAPLPCKDYIRDKLGLEKNSRYSIAKVSNKPTEYHIVPIPDDAPAWPGTNGNPSETWTYTNEAGQHMFYVLRFDLPDGSKRYSPLSYWSNGWQFKALPAPRPLYNLHLIAKYPNAKIIVCEGEKSADAGSELFPLPEYVCTTSSSGAKSANKTDWKPVKGRQVAIWPDADEAGKAYAADVTKLAGEAGAESIATITPPEDVFEGWDAANAIAQGWTSEQAIALAEGAAKDNIRTYWLRVIDSYDFLAMDIKPQEMLLHPIIPKQGLGMLYASRGMGKTYCSLAIAYAVATGSGFLRWKADKPHKVLIIDGEMPASALQERIAAIVSSSDSIPERGYLNILASDMQEFGLPSLTTKEGQVAIEPHLEGIELVIVDNISTICRGGRENDAESWNPVQEWALGLRRRGISVLFIHHAGKGEQQRGSSKKEDVLDTVIALKKPKDYEEQQGTRFEVKYEKHRYFHGDDAKPFEARLIVENGIQKWVVKDLDDCLIDEVMELKKEGLSVRKIADELKISSSMVHRLIKKSESERGHE